MRRNQQEKPLPWTPTYEIIDITTTETGWEEGGVDPITVETIGNCVRV